MVSPVIEFNNVSFGYNHRFFLKDINFSLNAEDFAGVIGPNGSGKTTLLKLMLGLLVPSSGDVKVFGKPPKTVSSLVGYVPQSSALDLQFPVSVFDLVLSGRLSHLPWWGRYRKEDKEAALSALKTVKLESFQNQPFGTLSSGQAQRVLIARALAAKPKLLVLDEPTASIDPASSEDILRILKTLPRPITIVMVSHNLPTVINDTQKILVVREGVTIMTPEEVCEHFAYGLYHTPLIPGAEH